MAQLHDEDAYIESVRKELIDAYKQASKSNHTPGADAAEAALASVNEAEAAVMTAENSVAQAEAVMETAK